MLNSIRWRLLLGLLGLLVLAAAGMGVVGYRSVLAETEALFDYQLRQTALSLRDQGEIGPDQARALRNEELDFVVQIWSMDGRSIYASRDHAELPTRALLGLADVQVGAEVWRTYSVATALRVIQVAQPRRIRRQLAADAALHSVAPLLVLAPLLALAMGALATLALRPLRTVARDLRGRDERSLAPLPEQPLPEELVPLVHALNTLLQRLGGVLDGQRAFVADAAHELRSPLTALKLQMAALSRAGDGPARQAAMEALGAGIDRAARLVEQLLALAREEPGGAPAADQAFDLTELARAVLADAVPAALQRGTVLALQADAPAPVRGDPAALRLLLRNLIDNALRHGRRADPIRPAARAGTGDGDPAEPLDPAPEDRLGIGRNDAGDDDPEDGGGRIVIAIAPQPDGATRLQVDDDGPGIPAEERERVFDRFYRRAGTTAEGSGLGLAIVRHVADRHGASVRLGDSPLGGLRVTLDLPPNPRFTER